MRPDATSLERIVPDALTDDGATGLDTLALHVERYEFAARCLIPGTLLDIACGVGYGTRLMCDRCSDIVSACGVDICAEAVSYARERYQNSHIDYVVSDAANFRPNAHFENIISLETIEHIPNPDRFIASVLALLKPGGVFVGSVPTTPSVDANPHHVTDFSEGSFARMVERHGMERIAEFRQRQPYNPLAVMRGKEVRSVKIRQNLPLYYAKHPAKLLLRAYATLRFGFDNRYITVAWKKRERE